MKIFDSAEKYLQRALDLRQEKGDENRISSTIGALILIAKINNN